MLPHHHIKHSIDACEGTHFSQTFPHISQDTTSSNGLSRMGSLYDTTDIHPLTNLKMVAITDLPQSSQAYIAADPDTLLDYHIYAEYYPYIAVDTDIHYNSQNMPESVQSVFTDIIAILDIDSQHNQDTDLVIDI